MLKMIRLAVYAAVLGMAKASWAAVVVGSFAGTLYDGTDGQGLFGPAGGDLANAAITGTYSYDTDLLNTAGNGANGALQVSVSVAGRTVLFDDAQGSNVAFDSSSGEVDIALSSSTGGYQSFLLAFVPASNGATGTGLAQSFSYSTFATSLGSFVLAGSDTTNGNFTLDYIAQSPTAVPEPGTLALMLPLACWIAARRLRVRGMDRGHMISRA